MTPEQWSVVGQIYRAAIERNAAERASFIANACGGNEVLQWEVESLISAEKEAGDFLQENAAKDFVAPSVSGALSLEGRKLGHYEFVSRLGTGGMGEVYRAHDTKLLRDVAIKILPQAVAQDVERLRRFEQEARVVSRLNHPNIVTIYETGQAEYGPFLVMELVQGETLRKAVEQALPLPEAVRICLQVAQALKVAHASNIVHRDIKPENLMLRADRYVKVLDFGLARLFPPTAARSRSEPASLEARESPAAITKPGMVVGTLRYMSPEQARCEDVSGASDIFSLGLILYELATGRHPFRATSEYGTLDGILSQSALAPSKINPEIPAALERLILRMLDKRAEARPSASDIEQGLSDIVHTDHFVPAKSVWHDSHNVVGRKREQEQLTALWNAAAAGHGSVCCISGEPGIGKTTLVGEFLSELKVSAGAFMWARGKCSERLAGTDAYAPFLEALNSLQRRDAGVEEIARRLAPTWYRQIASGALSEVDARAYSPQRIKRELVGFLQELSTRQTVGFFLEDLHWADLSTIDLLASLADRISHLRLLMVITYRPSHLFAQKHPLFKVKQDLRARRIAHEIELEFLSREEVAEYIALEFPQHRLPPAVADMIHAKTEGSPLFMTDLLRYFRDREVIAKKGERWELVGSLPEIERHLPESMRAMIERMIGQLDEDDRVLLLAASVQGNDFDSAVIARALGRDDAQVEERLQVVERAHQMVRLVEEREFSTGTLTLAYRFTHVLYQNALYVTIQPARRAQISNAVAEALVALHGEQSSPVALNLARLFEAGRTFQRAAECYLQATRNASRVFATTEAAELARQGLSMLQRIPQTAARDELEFSLQLALGNALMVILGYGAPEVEELYRKVHARGFTGSQPAQLMPILYGVWVSNLVQGNLERAIGYGKDFLDIAEQFHSPAVLVGQRMVGVPLFYLGELSRARKHLEEADSLYESAKHRALAWLYGQEPGMTTRSYLAWTMWILGYPDQAADHSRETVRLAREVDHSLSKGHGICFAAIHAHLSQNWGAFRELAAELVVIGRERNLRFWLPIGRVLSGLVHTKDGESEAGLAEMRSGIRDLIAANNKLNLTILYRLLAEAYSHLLRPEEGLVAIEEGLQVVEAVGEVFYEPELYRFRGELLLQQSGADAEIRAEECFQRAIRIARQQGAKSWELRAGINLGRLWRKRDKKMEAIELLGPLCEWFTEGCDSDDLQEARTLVQPLDGNQNNLSVIRN